MKKLIALLVILTGLAACTCDKDVVSGIDLAIIPEPEVVQVYVTNTVTLTNYVRVKTGVQMSGVTKKTKHNVTSLGGSICGRVYVGHDWVDIIDFGPVGLGLGAYATMNVADTARFWDIGAKVNVSY